MTEFEIGVPNVSAAVDDKLFSGVSWTFLNPRPAGVWLVTRPAEGPPEISQTTGPICKFQTPFDSPVRELPVQGKKFDPEVTDDVTGQVKVRIFDVRAWWHRRVKFRC